MHALPEGMLRKQYPMVSHVGAGVTSEPAFMLQVLQAQFALQDCPSPTSSPRKVLTLHLEHFQIWASHLQDGSGSSSTMARLAVAEACCYDCCSDPGVAECILSRLDPSTALGSMAGPGSGGLTYETHGAHNSRQQTPLAGSEPILGDGLVGVESDEEGSWVGLGGVHVPPPIPGVKPPLLVLGFGKGGEIEPTQLQVKLHRVQLLARSTVAVQLQGILQLLPAGTLASRLQQAEKDIAAAAAPESTGHVAAGGLSSEGKGGAAVEKGVPAAAGKVRVDGLVEELLLVAAAEAMYQQNPHVVLHLHQLQLLPGQGEGAVHGGLNEAAAGLGGSRVRKGSGMEDEGGSSAASSGSSSDDEDSSCSEDDGVYAGGTASDDEFQDAASVLAASSSTNSRVHQPVISNRRIAHSSSSSSGLTDTDSPKASEGQAVVDVGLAASEGLKGLVSEHVLSWQALTLWLGAPVQPFAAAAVGAVGISTGGSSRRQQFDSQPHQPQHRGSHSRQRSSSGFVMKRTRLLYLPGVQLRVSLWPRHLPAGDGAAAPAAAAAAVGGGGGTRVPGGGLTQQFQHRQQQGGDNAGISSIDGSRRCELLMCKLQLQVPVVQVEVTSSTVEQLQQLLEKLHGMPAQTVVEQGSAAARDGVGVLAVGLNRANGGGTSGMQQPQQRGDRGYPPADVLVMQDPSSPAARSGVVSSSTWAGEQGLHPRHSHRFSEGAASMGDEVVTGSPTASEVERWINQPPRRLPSSVAMSSCPSEMSLSAAAGEDLGRDDLDYNVTSVVPSADDGHSQSVLVVPGVDQGREDVINMHQVQQGQGGQGAAQVRDNIAAGVDVGRLLGDGALEEVLRGGRGFLRMDSDGLMESFALRQRLPQEEQQEEDQQQQPQQCQEHESGSSYEHAVQQQEQQQQRAHEYQQQQQLLEQKAARMTAAAAAVLLLVPDHTWLDLHLDLGMLELDYSHLQGPSAAAAASQPAAVQATWRQQQQQQQQHQPPWLHVSLQSTGISASCSLSVHSTAGALHIQGLSLLNRLPGRGLTGHPAAAAVPELSRVLQEVAIDQVDLGFKQNLGAGGLHKQVTLLAAGLRILGQAEHPGSFLLPSSHEADPKLQLRYEEEVPHLGTSGACAAATGSNGARVEVQHQRRGMHADGEAQSKQQQQQHQQRRSQDKGMQQEQHPCMEPSAILKNLRAHISDVAIGTGLLAAGAAAWMNYQAACALAAPGAEAAAAAGAAEGPAASGAAEGPAAAAGAAEGPAASGAAAASSKQAAAAEVASSAAEMEAGVLTVDLQLSRCQLLGASASTMPSQSMDPPAFALAAAAVAGGSRSHRGTAGGGLMGEPEGIAQGVGGEGWGSGLRPAAAGVGRSGTAEVQLVLELQHLHVHLQPEERTSTKTAAAGVTGQAADDSVLGSSSSRFGSGVGRGRRSSMRAGEPSAAPAGLPLLLLRGLCLHVREGLSSDYLLPVFKLPRLQVNQIAAGGDAGAAAAWDVRIPCVGVSLHPQQVWVVHSYVEEQQQLWNAWTGHLPNQQQKQPPPLSQQQQLRGTQGAAPCSTVGTQEDAGVRKDISIHIGAVRMVLLPLSDADSSLLLEWLQLELGLLSVQAPAPAVSCEVGSSNCSVSPATASSGPGAPSPPDATAAGDEGAANGSIASSRREHLLKELSCTVGWGSLRGYNQPADVCSEAHMWPPSVLQGMHLLSLPAMTWLQQPVGFRLAEGFGRHRPAATVHDKAAMGVGRRSAGGMAFEQRMLDMGGDEPVEWEQGEQNGSVRAPSRYWSATGSWLPRSSSDLSRGVATATRPHSSTSFMSFGERERRSFDGRNQSSRSMMRDQLQQGGGARAVEAAGRWLGEAGSMPGSDAIIVASWGLGGPSGTSPTEGLVRGSWMGQAAAPTGGAGAAAVAAGVEGSSRSSSPLSRSRAAAGHVWQQRPWSRAATAAASVSAAASGSQHPTTPFAAAAEQDQLGWELQSEPDDYDDFFSVAGGSSLGDPGSESEGLSEGSGWWGMPASSPRVQSRQGARPSSPPTAAGANVSSFARGTAATGAAAQPQGLHPLAGQLLSMPGLVPLDLNRHALLFSLSAGGALSGNGGSDKQQQKQQPIAGSASKSASPKALGASSGGKAAAATAIAGASAVIVSVSTKAIILPTVGAKVQAPAPPVASSIGSGGSCDAAARIAGALSGGGVSQDSASAAPHLAREEAEDCKDLQEQQQQHASAEGRPLGDAITSTADPASGSDGDHGSRTNTASLGGSTHQAREMAAKSVAAAAAAAVAGQGVPETTNQVNNETSTSSSSSQVVHGCVYTRTRCEVELTAWHFTLVGQGWQHVAPCLVHMQQAWEHTFATKPTPSPASSAQASAYGATGWVATAHVVGGEQRGLHLPVGGRMEGSLPAADGAVEASDWLADSRQQRYQQQQCVSLEQQQQQRQTTVLGELMELSMAARGCEIQLLCAPDVGGEGEGLAEFDNKAQQQLQQGRLEKEQPAVVCVTLSCDAGVSASKWQGEEGWTHWQALAADDSQQVQQQVQQQQQQQQPQQQGWPHTEDAPVPSGWQLQTVLLPEVTCVLSCHPWSRLPGDPCCIPQQQESSSKGPQTAGSSSSSSISRRRRGSSGSGMLVPAAASAAGGGHGGGRGLAALLQQQSKGSTRRQQQQQQQQDQDVSSSGPDLLLLLVKDVVVQQCPSSPLVPKAATTTNSSNSISEEARGYVPAGIIAESAGDSSSLEVGIGSVSLWASTVRLAVLLQLQDGLSGMLQEAQAAATTAAAIAATAVPVQRSKRQSYGGYSELEGYTPSGMHYSSQEVLGGMYGSTGYQGEMAGLTAFGTVWGPERVGLRVLGINDIGAADGWQQRLQQSEAAHVTATSSSGKSSSQEGRSSYGIKLGKVALLVCADEAELTSAVVSLHSIPLLEAVVMPLQVLVRKGQDNGSGSSLATTGSAGTTGQGTGAAMAAAVGDVLQVQVLGSCQVDAYSVEKLGWESIMDPWAFKVGQGMPQGSSGPIIA